LIVRHFGKVKATEVKKVWRQGRLQLYDLPAEFHENLPTASMVISGGQIQWTDRQHGEFISLTFSSKESTTLKG
jgi:hypothetical protein